LALARVQDLDVITTWASAGGEVPAMGTETPATPVDAPPVPSAPVGRGPEGPQPEDPVWAGGTVLADEREVRTDAPPEAVFAAVVALGGARGWHSASWMWEIRGILDELVGGIGLRRGRRHPTQLGVGEVVDFWRVDALERPSLLRLYAEMKAPGEAWLEFRIAPDGDGSRLTQRARFHPRGLWGRLYWYSLVPFHGLIFPRMAREFAQEAEAIHAAGRTEAVPPPPGRRRPRRR
ncbi:MAG: DUF2867 domain-containing protein, partial [Nitriliruptoraceae bacterium]